MKTRLGVLLLVAGCAAYGADRDFDRVAKAVESHYGVKRTHIPLMGVANLFVKVARPAGAKSFKLALFENMESASGYGDREDLNRLFDQLPAGGLNPLIRVHSRRNGESTYIYTGETGKSSRMLIATFGRNEATVIEVQVNMEVLMKVLASPEHAGQMFGLHHDRDRDLW